LTVLDVIVIAVVLISAALAMVRGFVREVLSIASWVIAAVVAYLLYEPVVPLLEPYIDSTTLRVVAAASAIFLVAVILATYITTKISDFVIDSRVGAFDRALGFLFGAARGLLLVVIALQFFNWLVQPSPTWVADAQTKPLLDDLGERLIAALPEDVESSLVRRFRGENDDAVAPTDGPPTNDVPGEPADPDYRPGQQEVLDQLIENAAPPGN
jgi:membrane protein required for colicin V production